MPSTSNKQHKAMEAAAHGKSTAGIPKKVGEDFAKADKGKALSTKALAEAMKRRRAKRMEPEADEIPGEES